MRDHDWSRRNARERFSYLLVSSPLAPSFKQRSCQTRKLTVAFLPNESRSAHASALLLDKQRANPLHCGMKLISLATIVLLATLTVAASPNEPKPRAKITKNEAEHIALKQYPGARVVSAKLESINGHLVWLLQVAQRPGQTAARVEVDAISGRIGMPNEKKP
jgi:uncharacterized membrane protein YkoI